MIKELVILAAGNGTKMWPYNEVRNKTMIPIATKPVLAHNVDSAIKLGVEKIYIITGKFNHEVDHYFSKYTNVKCINAANSPGTVDTLLAAETLLADVNNFAVLYGDTIIDEKDLKAIFESESNTILLSKLKETTRNYIAATIADGFIDGIVGHSREDTTHTFAGFHFDKAVWGFLKNTDDIMRDLEVGMMAPVERFIEATVSDMRRGGIKIKALETQGAFYDLDKPWHILEANSGVVEYLCSKLKKNELAEGANIDKTADIRGFVKLGKNSKIGRNVIVEGNLIVGDDTVIDNGAIILPNVVVANNVFIGHCCFISEGSSINDECFVGHAAEFWGVLMKRVYLYHYMEMFGVIGENTDIGAGTVCGTLRFDDGETPHRVKGRKEIPYGESNAIFLGDFSRTGVYAILMPGVKTGANSLVGPGVILSKDLPSKKVVFAKQDQVIRDWGPEHYGW
jgi:UDP-N-acetylglucosamine diphosphorylase / glucose-1-phosphate thymidylyltransferase / UDP-N-acetylgalactosamine diphosphorylase / glucosamine-1-phosphate N-acetyltransferase / galactosamine-1-phosphate N-acetyltransferase